MFLLGNSTLMVCQAPYCCVEKKCRDTCIKLKKNEFFMTIKDDFQSMLHTLESLICLRKTSQKETFYN